MTAQGTSPDSRAADLAVARVVVDTGLAHLDRPFDYAIPPAMTEVALPGVRLRVRFAGRLVDGWLLERVAASDHAGPLASLHAVVGGEQVLTPEVLALARAVADRGAGTLLDVLRLALPPRHARVEKEPPPAPAVVPGPPEPATWTRYPTGPAFLAALAEGRSPRAVWSALPGPSWPAEVAAAVQACAASGRGVVVVVPDARDLARVSQALAAVPHATLSADLGPAERYRRWLSALRGGVQVAVGTRAAAFAPVRDLGLVVVWDDGDDLHAEPRSPYPHVREVLGLRAQLTGAAMLVGGHARTAEGQLLVETGWATSLEAARATVRATAPTVDGTSEDQLARDPMAQAARLPAAAFAAARQALAAGAPVLVQVPRRGYVPSLACARDRTPARCPVCAGPLATTSRSAVAGCRWCGHLAGDWRCPACQGRALRASVVGAGRTAEELGRAFPGIPIRTSGREEVLATVPGTPALVVSTPGAEPVADGGYGAVLLLDGWAALGRADLRAGEEALRRWFAAAALARPAGDGGRVVVVADRALVPVQALIRWDPAGAASRELAERRALGFPPAVRMASVTGSAAAVTDYLAAVPPGVELLGPVPAPDGLERVLLRVPRRSGSELAAALKGASGVRSARKGEPVRVELDPRTLA
ncbi:MAG: primosomal protein N' [Frankiales bacterium]|nr:primosomal protein N' [Frankiales bacterium]